MAELPEQPMTVILAGKSGAGKTALSNILRGVAGNHIDLTPDSGLGTRELGKGSVKYNGFDIHIVDTPGLKDNALELKTQLKKISGYTNKKADLLIYCIPIGPGSRFEDCNPIAMRCLQEAYGRNIWHHCMVVFTMSNLALEHIKYQQKNFAENNIITVKYIGYVQTYAEKFRTELMLNLKVKDINVVTVFNLPQGKSSAPQPNTIVAIPAGIDPIDHVLPGFNTAWREVILEQITQRRDSKPQSLLLKYDRYRVEIAENIATGALLGAAIGATLGEVGGTVGIVLGAAMGCMLGVLVVLERNGLVTFNSYLKRIKMAKLA